MILEAAKWIYGALSSDSGLTAALVGGGGIVKIFPNTFEKLPILTYAVNQRESDMDFWDNAANANDVIVILDIYTKNSVSPTPIMNALDAVMSGLLFTLDFSQPLGDETAKTQHVSLRYSRQGVLAEDVA